MGSSYHVFSVMACVVLGFGIWFRVWCVGYRIEPLKFKGLGFRALRVCSQRSRVIKSSEEPRISNQLLEGVIASVWIQVYVRANTHTHIIRLFSDELLDLRLE